MVKLRQNTGGSKMSVTKVSEISNVPLSTLRNAIVKPIETWSIRVLNAFAIGLGERPGDLLNALEAQPYILDINDETQNEANIDQIAKLIKVENTPSRNRTLQLLASQQKNAQKQIRLPKTLDSKKSIAMIILTYSEVGNLLYALILGKAFYNLIISLKLLPNEKSPES